MKIVIQSFVILLFVLCAGCSSFQKKWDAVGAPGKYGHASRWEGRWKSSHHKTAAGAPEGGRLLCVLEPAADLQMIAHFHAYWQAFSANYDVTFQPKKTGPRRTGTVMEFRGTHELPKIFGGTYRYDARIVGDQFRAKYDSSYDSGTFEMTRQLTSATHFH